MALGSGDTEAGRAQELALRSPLRRPPPSAACGGTLRNFGAMPLPVPIMRAGGKTFFGIGPFRAKKEAGLQIISIKGFGKFGDILGVAGLRARLPRSFQWEFTLIWPLMHKSMRTGAMRCSRPGRHLRRPGSKCSE